MATIQTLYLGDLRTEITHVQSGNRVITDAPTDNNGKGEYISPTDMVAAALGSCMLTLMGIAARRLEIDLKGTRVEIQKVMAAEPRRIAEIRLDFYLPGDYSDKDKRKSCKARPKPVPSANRSIPTSGRRSPGITAVRNNGAGKIRRRLSRASSTATCATKPECGLFYLIANKIVFYLVINKEMFNFGSGGKLLPALFREFSELSEQGSDRKP
ncbi:MAG: OsmC family protein [Alistipes putredinis]